MAESGYPLNARWLRQVSVTLIYAIGLIGWLDGPARAINWTPVHFASVHVIKFEVSRPTECVHIVDSSPYENGLISIPNCREVTVFEWPLWYAGLSGGSWTDDGYPTPFRAVELGTFGIKDIDRSPAPRFVSRGQSEVLEANVRLKKFSALISYAPFNRAAFSENISAQLPLGGFFRTLDQITSSSPEKDCGEGKNYREGGDNAFSVVMDESPQTVSIIAKRNSDVGNAFLKIVFGWGALLLSDTALKCS